MAGWQMAPYDQSSIAYSDSHSGSGSCSEIVPYSPLGVGFEHKERQFVVSSRMRVASRRLSSAARELASLSRRGLVSWNGLRIVQRKVAIRSGNRMRGVGSPSWPKLITAGSGSPRSPKKSSGLAKAEGYQANVSARTRVVNARQQTMLPEELTELLPALPASSAAGAERRRRLAGVLALGSTKDADTLAGALVQLADRFKACIEDVQSTAYAQRVPSCGLQVHHSSGREDDVATGRAARLSLGAPQVESPGSGSGSWLAETMAWLRGRHSTAAKVAQMGAQLPVEGEQPRDCAGGGAEDLTYAQYALSSPDDNVISAIWSAVEHAVLHACREVCNLASPRCGKRYSRLGCVFVMRSA